MTNKVSAMSPDLLSESYDYSLPEEHIASYPLNPPSSAKLLVYDRSKDTIHHSTFAHITEYLPEGSHIFFNDTKVIKARLFGQKSSGGKIELLFDKPYGSDLFGVMIRGRVKKGDRLFFKNDLQAEIMQLKSDGIRIVRFLKKGEVLRFQRVVEILERIGHVPLPPYIRREDERSDESNYQSLFAKKNGAVAAPTASLHFCKDLIEKIGAKHTIQTLTLHVGAGTFKPVDAKQILSHKMHSEYFEIPKESAKIINSDAKIVAVGTTVTRTIEYYYRTGISRGECNLFLHPQNRPQRVDSLVTNFHLPKSTLIMLVSSFLGREKTLELYGVAIGSGYRFYSYGDGMLIL